MWNNGRQGHYESNNFLHVCFPEWEMSVYCSVNVFVSLVASELFIYFKCGLIRQICVSINNKYSAEQDTEYL